MRVLQTGAELEPGAEAAHAAEPEDLVREGLERLIARGGSAAELRGYVDAHPAARAELLALLHERVGNAVVAQVLAATPTTTANPMFAELAAAVRKAGGTVDKRRPTVLGVRTQADASPDEFLDVFYVLHADGRVQAFRGSSVPSMYGSTDSPDIDRDGKGDVGVLRPGNFEVIPNKDFLGRTSFYVVGQNKKDGLPAWRDTDTDGVFSDEEKAASEQRKDKITQVLFHTGSTRGPMSVGCMTLPHADLDAFVAAVGGEGAAFRFTLVDRSSLELAPEDAPLGPAR